MDQEQHFDQFVKNGVIDMASPTKARPSASTSKTPAPAPTPVKGTGSRSIDVLLKALDDVEFGGSGDIHRFCEALRALGHKLAVETSMSSGQLEARLKAEAKSNATLNIPGVNARTAIRRVVRQLSGAADHFADAAACAVSAWTTYEKEFDALIYPEGKKPTKRPFSFTMD